MENEDVIDMTVIERMTDYDEAMKSLKVSNSGSLVEFFLWLNTEAYGLTQRLEEGRELSREEAMEWVACFMQDTK